MYLLRLYVRANKFDQKIRGATETIIKNPLSDDADDQASMSPRFGGLGIRRVVEHAPVAFQASYTMSRETWLNPN